RECGWSSCRSAPVRIARRRTSSAVTDNVEPVPASPPLLRRSDLLINRREHPAVTQEKLHRFLWTLVPWSTQTEGARLEVTVRGGAEQMAPNDFTPAILASAQYARRREIVRTALMRGH